MSPWRTDAVTEATEGIRAPSRAARRAGRRRTWTWPRAATQKPLACMDASTQVEFSRTPAYYLPVIYAITGHKVETLDDMRWVLDKAEQLMIPAAPAEKLWLPYLGATLDAGMAALWLAEIIEALKYVGVGRLPACRASGSAPLTTSSCAQRGVEFVDGSAPGFAAVTGAAPDVETAVALAREMQEKYALRLHRRAVARSHLRRAAGRRRGRDGLGDAGWCPSAPRSSATSTRSASPRAPPWPSAA